MKISCCWLYAISKYGYPPTLSDTFRALREMKALGFDCAELEGVGEKNLLKIHAQRHELKKLCDGEGLRIVNFCPILRDSVDLDAVKRSKARELFLLGIEIANFFGCATIQGDSFTPALKFRGESPYRQSIQFGKIFSAEIDPQFDWSRQWSAMVESFSYFAREAKKAGLKFCVEPRVGEMLSNTDALMRMMDHVGEDNFGAVLDTAHLHAQKEILALSVEKLGKRIFYVHAADNDGRMNEHLAPGRGTVDWDGVFAGLQKHRYTGYVAVDIGMVPELDAQYREALRFLKKRLAAG